MSLGPSIEPEEGRWVGGLLNISYSPTPTFVPAPHPASPIHVSGTMPSALGTSGFGMILPDLVDTRTRSPASVNLHSTSVGFLVEARPPGSSLPAIFQPKSHHLISLLPLDWGFLQEVMSMRWPLSVSSTSNPPFPLDKYGQQLSNRRQETL